MVDARNAAARAGWCRRTVPLGDSSLNLSAETHHSNVQVPGNIGWHKCLQRRHQATGDEAAALVGGAAALRQDGADYAVLTVPTDEVDFTDAAREGGEHRRGASVSDRFAPSGLAPEGHQRQDDRPLRMLDTRAIDVEEIPESRLVVGLAG